MFIIDQKLEADSHYFTKLNLCQVRLMDDQNFPWILLIPEIEGLTELTDLSEGQQIALMREINFVSRKLQDIFAPDKMNVATLGNQVKQLHIHIIGRYEGDNAWPNPVFGSSSKPYSEKVKTIMLNKLKPISE